MSLASHEYRWDEEAVHANLTRPKTIEGPHDLVKLELGNHLVDRKLGCVLQWQLEQLDMQALLCMQHHALRCLGEIRSPQRIAECPSLLQVDHTGTKKVCDHLVETVPTLVRLRAEPSAKNTSNLNPVQILLDLKAIGHALLSSGLINERPKA